MKKTRFSQVTKVTSPNPVTLVCTQRPDGTTNIGTFSWWTPVSFGPDLLVLALGKGSYTGERIRETGEAIVVIPGAENQPYVMGCGSAHGSDADKVADLGIDLEDVEDTDIKVPEGAAAALVAKLIKYDDLGSDYLYLLEVTSAHVNPDTRALFAWDGYARVAPAVEE